MNDEIKVLRDDDAEYEPVPGIPGETLEEQYQALGNLVDSGDATENQANAVRRKLAERFPKANEARVRQFQDAMEDLHAAWMQGMSVAERERILWQYRNHDCRGCNASIAFLGAFVDDDGRAKEG